MSMGCFQERVWVLLQRIPRGRVAMYGELARALGNPKAARAVAQACARNPHPVVVPCHRVVCGDGAIGGYSAPGGVRRKAELLRAEGIPVHGMRITNIDRYRYGDVT